MKVQVFAVLKDYFEKEFLLEDYVGNTKALKESLLRLNPAASGILEICRFAVNDEFIDDQYQFSLNDSIFIIPPASGG
ncbi:MAG: MoaD/ThiS family protein [Chitinophagaceae bacterium]